MRKLWILILILLAQAVQASSAQAQIFSKKNRPNPNQRVPELIVMIKTETDERKRVKAAEELREYDPRTYAEIVPVLIDVLYHDQKPAVRLEALNSLNKLRPVTSFAGQAIEHAAARDENVRVRMHAKSTLVKYHLAGYVSGKSDGSLPSANTEPPTIEIKDAIPEVTTITPTNSKASTQAAPPARIAPVVREEPPAADIIIPAPALRSPAPPAQVPLITDR